ncbi:hypothetical protein GC194_02450 [bacterium]|nr:hypothetical protein [bacterium]
MRTLLILVLGFACLTAKGQSAFDAGIKLEQITEFCEKSDFDEMYFKMGLVSIFKRNDSLVLRYTNSEYLLPVQAIATENIMSARIVDFTFFFIEVLEYESNTTSVYGNWFSNNTRLYMIELSNAVLVDIGIIASAYSETRYTYDGDVYDETLTKEAAQKLYDTRKADTERCEFVLSYHFEQNILTVAPSKGTLNTYECFTAIKPGSYEWRGDGFVELKD